MKKSVFGLPENVAGVVAYAGVFITGIAALILEKENKFVRFCALQSTIWFLFLFIAGWVVRIFSFIPFIGFAAWLVGWLVGALGVVSWLYLMYTAFTGKEFKIPVIGDVVWAQINK